MKLHIKRLYLAALLVLAMQPVYLLALVATDYLAPPDIRLERMQGVTLKIPTTEECVALATGLEPGVAALHNAIMNARPLFGELACDALVETIAKNPNVTWLPYPRYWHGYRVILDPLLTWLPIDPVRHLMLAAMFAGLTWLSFELRYLAGAEAAVAFMVPTVVLTDLWACWIYAVHTLPIIAILLGSALVARQARRPESNLILTAAVLGSVFNYVDFLINVPWQPMVLAFIVLLAGRRGPEALAVVVAWFAGYSLTWASKWVIACAAGVSWSDILDVIIYRLNGHERNFVDHRFLAPTRKVIGQLFRPQQSALLFLFVLPSLLLLPAWRWNPRRFAFLASPALIPLIWFELLSNHSQIHAWITYRPLASCIGILLAAAIIASREAAAGERSEYKPAGTTQRQAAD